MIEQNETIQFTFDKKEKNTKTRFCCDKMFMFDHRIVDHDRFSSELFRSSSGYSSNFAFGFIDFFYFISNVSRRSFFDLGSPFNVKVMDMQRVVVFGKGLGSIPINTPTSFTVLTQNAGTGELKCSIKGRVKSFSSFSFYFFEKQNKGDGDLEQFLKNDEDFRRFSLFCFFW